MPFNKSNRSIMLPGTPRRCAECCHRPPLLDGPGGRQPGGRTLLRRSSYQPPIRSLLARRRLHAVVADLKATDRNEGTKPVFKGVNPVCKRAERAKAATANRASVPADPHPILGASICDGRARTGPDDHRNVTVGNAAVELAGRVAGVQTTAIRLGAALGVAVLGGVMAAATAASFASKLDNSALARAIAAPLKRSEAQRLPLE
jgi:hypothetical protein